MSKRIPKLLLEDILYSANKIIIYTYGLGLDDFIKNEIVLDAVIRNFEIIGEAANRLPDDIKNIHEEIDWYRIIGFRNRIVHDYIGIDYEIVWNIMKNYLPELIEKITIIVNIMN